MTAIYQPKRTISKEELRPYCRLETRAKFEGLCPELLADLRDSVISFGIPDEHNHFIIRLQRGEPQEIHITANSTDKECNLVIIGAGGKTSQGSYLIRLSNVRGGLVIWDKRVGVQDVINLIQSTDLEAAEMGWIKKDGNRIKGERNQIDASIAFGVCERVTN